MVLYILDTRPFSSVQVSCSVMSDSLRPHGLQHARHPCPLPTPGVYSNSCPLVSDTIQPSHPCRPPFPPTFHLSQHQGLFPTSQFFTSGGQSIGISASASVLPMNIQKRSPLRWFDLLAVQGTLKSLLQHHSSKAINSLRLSLLYGPALTSVHDYWENYSFDYADLCQQSAVSAF